MALPRRAVLLVDDDVAIREALAEALAEEGFPVHAARNGKEALDWLQRAMDLAGRMRSGMTSINSVIAFASVPSLPFGGVGESGFGRIHGEDGLREFARPQAVATRRFPLPVPVTSFSRSPRTMKALVGLVRARHGR